METKSVKTTVVMILSRAILLRIDRRQPTRRNLNGEKLLFVFSVPMLEDGYEVARGATVVRKPGESDIELELRARKLLAAQVAKWVKSGRGVYSEELHNKQMQRQITEQKRVTLHPPRSVDQLLTDIINQGSRQ